MLSRIHRFLNEWDDKISNMGFLIESVRIFILVALFLLQNPIDVKPALVQVKAWCRIIDKDLWHHMGLLDQSECKGQFDSLWTWNCWWWKWQKLTSTFLLHWFLVWTHYWKLYHPLDMLGADEEASYLCSLGGICVGMATGGQTDPLDIVADRHGIVHPEQVRHCADGLAPWAVNALSPLSDLIAHHYWIWNEANSLEIWFFTANNSSSTISTNEKHLFAHYHTVI